MRANSGGSRDRLVLPWLLAGCAVVVALAFVFRAHWLLLTHDDLGVPRGLYRCSVSSASGMRECTIGVDGIILRKERLPDGSVHRTWFCDGDGRTVCHREETAMVLEAGGVCPQRFRSFASVLEGGAVR
jgi:hypothetical protein